MLLDTISFDPVPAVIVWESSRPRARETLYLEKDNTPLLAKHYAIWKLRLLSTEPYFVLRDLSEYLRTEVFDLRFCCRSMVEEIVKQANSELLSIELFVQKKTGLCRHFALTAYYFLEKARQECLLPISSNELIRKTLLFDGLQGRHAWLSISLEENNRSFHFDPFWGIVVDSDDPEAFETLKKIYGI